MLQNTIVFPYRRRKMERRGFSEARFESQIKGYLANTRYIVCGDVSMQPFADSHPYEPDIAIIEQDDKYGIRIDIEIDEPYSGYDKTPIHYINGGDVSRDLKLTNAGWIVIRFSEKQIVCEPNECIRYIQDLIHKIDCDFLVNVTCDHPSPDKRWTMHEAQIMALKQTREHLLNHVFRESETTEQIIVTQQTQLEIRAAAEIRPLQLPRSICKNLDNSRVYFRQDDRLSFEPKEHIYIYDGKIQLKAVSDIISLFFETFDALKLSEQIARKDRIDQEEVLEMWDCNGCESRELGTFLHSQIESFLSNEPITLSTHFNYDGQYIKIAEKVSIQKEFSYFQNFLSDHPITPFRTEWHIFDSELKIAGTIDMLCKHGEHFEIYDWKRSKTASPDELAWRNGINGLQHIPDTRFFHYAIQQNLYKYILEKNYGLLIDNMYIVVLHPEYNNYKRYCLPKMDKEMEILSI